MHEIFVKGAYRSKAQANGRAGCVSFHHCEKPGSKVIGGGIVPARKTRPEVIAEALKRSAVISQR
jgi:hypothetical protein